MMKPPKEKSDHSCERCGKVQSAARLPIGWKRTPSGEQCKACWRSQYVARAVTIPIWGSGDEKPFADFCAALAGQWAAATRLANMIHTERYARDVRREAGAEKLAPMQAAYLYPMAREACPSLMPSVVVAIDHAETGKYRAKRYDLLWTGRASLANVRYPYPLPLPSETIGFERDPNNGRVVVSIRFGAAADGTRWKLRLAGGRDYQRQLAAVAKMMSGEVELIEGTLLRRSARSSDGRSGAESDGKSPNAKPRIMLKLVGWFPVSSGAEKEPGNTMSLKSGSEEFLSALVEGRDSLWMLHADHVRDWIFQHDRRRARVQSDQKSTGWRPKRRRKQARQTVSEWVEKHRARIDSFIKESAAAVLREAVRGGVSRIRYDDSDRSYFPSFAWDRLRQQLTAKCEERGIVFEVASSGEAQSKLAAARKDSKVSHAKSI